jgi:hypothetical protein
MKKSWHPLLLKNQERVWLEEKKAVSHVCDFKNLTNSFDTLARGEEETRSTSQGEGGRAPVTGATAASRRTNGEKENGKIGVDVFHACHRVQSESK